MAKHKARNQKKKKKKKKNKAQNTQKETLTFPLSAWRMYTEDLFQEGSYHQRYL